MCTIFNNNINLIILADISKSAMPIIDPDRSVQWLLRDVIDGTLRPAFANQSALAFNQIILYDELSYPQTPNIDPVLDINFYDRNRTDLVDLQSAILTAIARFPTNNKRKTLLILNGQQQANYPDDSQLCLIKSLLDNNGMYISIISDSYTKWLKINDSISSQTQTLHTNIPFCIHYILYVRNIQILPLLFYRIHIRTKVNHHEIYNA